MESRRTCDRCYKIKARCDFSAEAKACQRCARLGHQCQTRRPFLPTGRPRKVGSTSLSSPKTISPTSATVDNHDLVLSRCIAPSLEGFDPSDMTLVEFLLHTDQIKSLTYVQSFSNSMRSELTADMMAAPDRLKDAFLACSEALAANKAVVFSAPGTASHLMRGSRALQSLRTLDSVSFCDVQVALSLALSLITYNDLSLGRPTLPITQSALMIVQPWRKDFSTHLTEGIQQNLIAVLFAEMAECVLYRQVPIFKYTPPTHEIIIGRYYGICHALLQQFYDICVLSQSVHRGLVSGEALTSHINQISKSIGSWSPLSASTILNRVVLEDFESQHILLQAEIYQLTAQLLLLQLQRSPQNDELSQAGAMRILSKISAAQTQSKDRPRYLLFPMFVACVELYSLSQDDEKAVQRHLNEVSNNMAPKACESMFACLQHIWKTRRKYPNRTWFDCVEGGPQSPIGP